MTVPLVKRLSKLIQARDWVQGAVNYDEDLHFSTFYLRSWHARHAVPLYPGYTFIFAFYAGFNEYYYLLRNECRSNAVAIVNKALQRPGWLPRILRGITRRSDALARVFPPQTSPAWLAGLADATILALYHKHAAHQRALYKMARLPEALDRGDGYFSTYLHEHLRRVGLSTSACDETFAVLSQPEVHSVLAQELLDFEDIVRLARADGHALAQCSPGRARMVLAPDVVRRLRTHHAKWQYLPYHGYGRRQPATLEHYVERLVERLHHPEDHGHAHGILQRVSQAKAQRQQTLNHLHMDSAHQALFEVYPEIGAAKLYRRLAQLRNFYYLDMLLAEIAQRLHVSEWTLRCMLPEEIIAALQSGDAVSPAIRERGQHCLFAMLADEEFVLTGSEAAELRQLFQARDRSRLNGHVLHGTVACRGAASGPCRVIIRADDFRQQFARGSILVSESTDPDLIGFFPSAGGILTEQGGVTSHAAIICRELGIPTIVGIQGLLDRVRDGDVVSVDAHRGLVTLVQSKPAPPPGMVFDTADLEVPGRIGAKAANLGRVRALGFAVPEYVVLRHEGVKRLLRRPSPGARRRLVHWVLDQLDLPAGGRLALRSSALDEDGDQGSQAGAYRSLLNVGADKLIDGLDEFVRCNAVKAGRRTYRGAIILQRMIDADCAGVCLTADHQTGRGTAMIVELVAGGNQTVTQGTGRPDRVVVDRLTGDILENRRSRARAARGADLADLAQQFLTLEAQFGKPLDIEWALKDGKLYILQTRPIVS
jgi:phosphohistidine swiveling domain-containing protein